jgi:MFS family permease
MSAISSASAQDNVPVSTEQTPLLRPAHETSIGDRNASISFAANDLHAAVELPSEDHENDGNSTRKSLSATRIAACAVGIGSMVLLQTFNISLLTTTQSAVAEALDAFDLTTWFTSSYLITSAAMSPLAGKLLVIFSPRIGLLVAAVLMALGSGLASIAPTFAAFIMARVVTGIGSAGIITGAIVAVLELSGPKHKGLGIGLINSGFTIGVSVGAVVAGAIVEALGWRALFWLQVPILLVGGILTWLAIPSDLFSKQADNDSQSSRTSKLAQIDYLGALTLTTSIVLVLSSLSSPKKIPILPLILSPIVAATFVLNELCLAKEPIIPISLLRSRGLLATCIATVGYMMSRWTVLFYTPTYALVARDWAPALAGTILIPTNAGFALGGILAGWLHIRRSGGYYTPTLICYIVFPATLLALALLVKRDTSIVLIMAALTVSGIATGAALNYSLAHLLHVIPPETAYIATALLTTFRSFAGSFGSAIGGGLFMRSLGDALRRGFEEHGDGEQDELVRRLLGSPALVGSLHGARREIAISGYEEALRTLFLAAAGLSAVMIFVQASVGRTGHAGRTRSSIADTRPADQTMNNSYE